MKKKSGSIKQVFGFFRGPGGFRELREAYRNHFHLSWYLRVPRITSMAQNLGVICFYRPQSAYSSITMIFDFMLWQLSITLQIGIMKTCSAHQQRPNWY